MSNAPLFVSADYDWPDDNRILILGQTGSGKSWLARKLLNVKYCRLPILVYQSKPKVGVLDRLAAARAKTVSRAIRQLADGEPLVILKPDPIEALERSTTEELCERVLYLEGDLLLYIDEIAAFTSFRPLPAPNFAALLTQGRELGKGVMMAAQEPAYLPRVVYAESQVIIRMYVHGEVNLKAVRDKLPRALAETPLPPGQHSFVLWDSRLRDRAFSFRRAV